jgi:hypothetical protein
VAEAFRLGGLGHVVLDQPGPARVPQIVKADIEAFRQAHRATRATAFTSVDRAGDPDEMLTAPQAARVLGYANHRSLSPTMLDRPDDVTEPPSCRLRHRWYRRTVWTFADTRPDRHSTGRPPGTGSHRQPHTAYANDPRLAAARQLLHEASDATAAGLAAQLARDLGISERTGQRLIAAAGTTSPVNRTPRIGS